LHESQTLEDEGGKKSCGRCIGSRGLHGHARLGSWPFFSTRGREGAVHLVQAWAGGANIRWLAGLGLGLGLESRLVTKKKNRWADQ